MCTDRQSTYSQSGELEGHNILLDIAWREYDAVFEGKSQQDQKVSIITASIGLVVGFLVANSDNIQFNFFFLWSCIIFLEAFILSLYIIFPRSYDVMSSDDPITEVLVIDIGEEDNVKATQNLTDTICNKTTANLIKFEKTEKALTICVPLSIIGFIFFLLSFILGKLQ